MQHQHFLQRLHCHQIVHSVVFRRRVSKLFQVFVKAGQQLVSLDVKQEAVEVMGESNIFRLRRFSVMIAHCTHCTFCRLSNTTRLRLWVLCKRREQKGCVHKRLLQSEMRAHCRQPLL